MGATSCTCLPSDQKLACGNAAAACVNATGMPNTPGDNKEVLANCLLLRASAEGNVKQILEALKEGANVEVRRPMVIKLTGEDDADFGEEEMLDMSLFSCKKKSGTRGAGPHGLTPLMYAAREGHKNAVTTLLRQKATPHSQDEDGITPLHFAAGSGCYECCKALLHARADPSIEDDTARTAFAWLPGELRRGRYTDHTWVKILDPAERPPSSSLTWRPI